MTYTYSGPACAAVGTAIGSSATVIESSHVKGRCAHSTPKMAREVRERVVRISVSPVARAVVPSLEERKKNWQEFGLLTQYRRPSPLIVILFVLMGMMVLGVE